MGARLDGRNHRPRGKAERLEEENADSKRERRKRGDYSDQAIPAAVPRAPEQFPVASREAVRMNRADQGNEQRDEIPGQFPAPKHEHVAQYDDQRKRKIRGGPARPGDVQHSQGLAQKSERGRNPFPGLAIYGGGFHRNRSLPFTAVPGRRAETPRCRVLQSRELLSTIATSVPPSRLSGQANSISIWRHGPAPSRRKQHR